MRGIPDRFWWLQRAVGIMLAIGSFLVLSWQVITLFTSYSLLHENEFGRLVWEQNLALTGGYALALAWAIIIIWGSFSAHGRYRRRALAIQGDQDAMLRANVLVQPNHAPDLANEPVELLWRATRSNGRAMTIVYVVLVLILGPLVVLFVYVAYCLVTNTPPIGATDWTPPNSPFERGGLIAVCMVVAATFIFVLWLLARYLPSQRGRPYGVIAASDGLWYYPRAGKKRFLRWEEVRLFEIDAPRGHYRGYKLYGRDAIAEWWDQPLSSSVSLVRAKQEFEERNHALLNLIAARTHLLPRTLDKKLAVAEASAPA